MEIHLFVTPVDQLQRQLGGRSYSKLYHTRPRASVLSRKKQVSFDFASKIMSIPGLEDIFLCYLKSFYRQYFVRSFYQTSVSLGTDYLLVNHNPPFFWSPKTLNNFGTENCPQAEKGGWYCIEPSLDLHTSKMFDFCFAKKLMHQYFFLYYPLVF